MDSEFPAFINDEKCWAIVSFSRRTLFLGARSRHHTYIMRVYAVDMLYT